MLKRIAKVALEMVGLQLRRIPKRQPSISLFQKAAARRGKQDVISALSRDPLNESLHFQYADYALTDGNPYLAYAELKTAEALGADRKKVASKLAEIKLSLPNLKRLNHNRYFRFSSLASEIISRAGGSNISVLDVGGGNGQLAAFIPGASYCLAEPTVNGISGTNLPFPNHSFDYVVSCHVLEHVPVIGRVNFLEQLLHKAKRGIFLLNPFHVQGTFVEERLNLIIELTGAQWAKEHLDCTLPNVQDIMDFADERGLDVYIKPNGTMATSLAFVFVDYFAIKSGLYDEWEKLNTFFNEKYTEFLDSKEYPTAYLIYLGWPQTKDVRAEHRAQADS